MTVPKSVIVAGGGIVGLCTAVALQEAGVDARLIDPMSGGEASWGNAGCIAVDECAPLASPATVASVRRRMFGAGGPVDFVWGDVADWAPFALRFLEAATPERFAAGVAALSALNADAVGAWRRLLGEAKASDLLRLQGHFVLSQGQDAEARVLKELTAAPKGGAAFRRLNEDERTAFASLLTLKKGFGGARVYGTGQVRSHTGVFEALYARLIRAGGVISRGRVRVIGRAGGRCVVALEEDVRWDADAVVIAAGVRSRPLLAAAGLHAPVIAERGYHIGFQSPHWPEDFPAVLFADLSVMTTRLDTGVRATSFVEFGRPDSPPDPRKWDRLERDMKAVGLLRGGHVTRWMGSRPTFPDYLPAIGGGERPGLFYAFGHAHLGLTQAAATAELVRALVLQKSPAVDLAPFSLSRFRTTGGSAKGGR